MIETHVTNTGPQTTQAAPKKLRYLFQRYTRTKYGQAYEPFEHQAQVFRLVGEQNQSVLLVAGTAAGKTLAVSVPLFHKLASGQIKRVLLMYPTIALMNDQRKVMNTIAELQGLHVGHIQGGMRRSQLIAALNKPVIVATPDAIYWFFHKNVKYAGLLIYSLALIDEFVLDEAHLFNGLMLQNVQHLKQRIEALGNVLGRAPRWHILTATPTPALQALIPDAQQVNGKSKCGDVKVKFLPPVEPKQRDEILVHAIHESLASGARKVLQVRNSAAAIHRQFEEIRGEQPDLPIDLQIRFGHVAWGELRPWMIERQCEDKIISAVTGLVEREGPFYLRDLRGGDQVSLSTEILVSASSHFLQKVGKNIKDAAYTAGRENTAQTLTQAVTRRLRGQGKAVQKLWQTLQADLPQGAAPDTIKQTLNTQITVISDALARTWDQESLSVTAPDFMELNASLKAAGLSDTLSQTLSRYLQHSIELDEQESKVPHKSQKCLDKRTVPLRWFETHWLIQDKQQRHDFRRQLQAGLEKGKLKVETRHICTWPHSDVPTILYTGQMSRRDREGLIEAFDTLDRAILVSTPAVEVGVDFKADVLITEECDGNGFLQRFGRVGRTGDSKAQVIALVREGETWVRLLQRIQPEMNREAFSQLIIDPNAPSDPTKSLFPDQTYATDSTYLDATHWLINRQIGRIGQRLNAAMSSDPSVAALARQIIAADLSFTYGLRGTLPGISLLGGGGSSPFYVLSKVHDSDLWPSSSPFEIAEAQMGYTRFLYAKNRWDIQVEWEQTLRASRAMFYRLDGHWQIATGYGVAETFLKSFGLANRFRNNIHAMCQKLSNVKNPNIQAVLRLGTALELHNTSQAEMILGQGDVFLKRVERDSGISTLVKDCLDNPLVLPDQLWLYIKGKGSAEKAWRQLQSAGLEALGEIQYPQRDEQRVILLDKVAGACFHVYERLLEHVD